MLGSKEILKLIKEKEMVQNYINLEQQLQPNSFDLTVDKVFISDDCSVLREKDKHLPKVDKIKPRTFSVAKISGWYLTKGTYLFEVNEIVKLPKNISALSNQRSSLMRMFCRTNIGSWDCGYNGKGYSILTVLNPMGLWLEKNVRIIQMHFFKTSKVLESYNGQYQGENLKHE